MDKALKKSTQNFIATMDAQDVLRSEINYYKCMAILSEYIKEPTLREVKAIYKKSDEAYTTNYVGFEIDDYFRILAWRYSQEDFTTRELKRMSPDEIHQMVEDWTRDGGAYV